MNLQKLPLMLVFNGILAVTDILLLSKGLLSFTGIARILIVIISIVVFIIGNYLILASAFKKPVLKNKTNADADDFESAFKGWKGMSTPFSSQIDTALKQIEKLQSLKHKLKALTDDSDSTFESAVEEVESSMFRNFNRIINRFIIYDKSDINDINQNANYINNTLETNAKYLDVFKKFIDEVSMIGDSTDTEAKTLSLQLITESLREIRTNGEE